jgi:hypothetical protein
MREDRSAKTRELANSVVATTPPEDTKVATVSESPELAKDPRGVTDSDDLREKAVGAPPLLREVVERPEPAAT